MIHHSRQLMICNVHKITLLSLILMSLSVGCDFINSAAELTFGKGQIPELSQQLLYPSVDQLSGIDPSSSDAIPGLPSTLKNGTMAHLAGALTAQGLCEQVIDLSEGGLASNLEEASFRLSACTEDNRCQASCGDDFFGIDAHAQLTMKVLEGKQTEELTQLIDERAADAIIQIRLQISQLDFFQGDDSQREIMNDYIQDFEMKLRVPDGEFVTLIGPNALQQVAQGPQRYEIPRDSEVAKTLISQILNNEDVYLEIEQRFRIPRGALYLMNIEPAGVAQKIQPEVVINALEIATATLTEE